MGTTFTLSPHIKAAVNDLFAPEQHAEARPAASLNTDHKDDLKPAI